MPAASWSLLQRFELQFDAALGGSDDFALSPESPILSVFTAAPYGFTLYPQQSAETLVAPRLEFQFALGRPVGPGKGVQMRAEAGLSPRATAYGFSLLFRFIYDRALLDAAGRAFDGALRELLAPPPEDDPESAAFNLATLPWLNVSGMQEVRAFRGIVRDEERAKQLDAWESNWEGIFNIRPEAMPD